MSVYRDHLGLAISWACEAHDGQVDKADQPYILHALRVMQSQPDEDARIAAVLHDTLEDGDKFDLVDVADYFGADVHDAVDALTRREGEDYFAYIDRCYANQIARRVKIADLKDNMNPAREARDGKHASRFQRYSRALCILTDQTVVAP